MKFDEKKFIPDRMVLIDPPKSPFELDSFGNRITKNLIGDYLVTDSVMDKRFVFRYRCSAFEHMGWYRYTAEKGWAKVKDAVLLAVLTKLLKEVR